MREITNDEIRKLLDRRLSQWREVQPTKGEPSGTLAEVYASEYEFTCDGLRPRTCYSPFGEWLHSASGELNRTVNALPYTVFAFLLYTRMHDNLQTFVSAYGQELDSLVGPKWMLFVSSKAEQVIIDPSSFGREGTAKNNDPCCDPISIAGFL